eukprot:CAMPEP_0113665340 /NCGR_PEP_ID=MMETSP0038_2-20120614/2250_1 /TAXON_ID=2898 /ORGANISM="Cryptomonas paramecium" /LENGTH=49 /DNA_ID=CAMNT_0000580681 /DNA_START=374 /DNA_END=519 /DNA_ORIENTATION=+ /assembly_acc=CAM_ASM_000170
MAIEGFETCHLRATRLLARLVRLVLELAHYVLLGRGARVEASAVGRDGA